MMTYVINNIVIRRIAARLTPVIHCKSAFARPVVDPVAFKAHLLIRRATESPIYPFDQLR